MKFTILTRWIFFLWLVATSCGSPQKNSTTVSSTVSDGTTSVSLSFEQMVLDTLNSLHPRVADIDGDRKNDIIMVRDYFVDGDDAFNIKYITLFKGPDWEKHTLWDINYRADDLKLADIDGDDDMDVVGRFADRDDQEGNVFWMENPRPDGNVLTDNWKQHIVGLTDDYVKDFGIADYDQDGKLDIAARENEKLYVWFQEDSDTWQATSMDIHDHEGMGVGDLDQDGDTDIVLNGYWMENPANPLTDAWTEHNIDEKWWKQSTGSWTDNNCRIEIADMNSDGHPDVLLSNSEKAGYPVSWYESHATAEEITWQEHILDTVDYCHTLYAKDMDGDGDLDVVTGELIHSSDPAPNSPHPLVIFINKGDATSWAKLIPSEEGIYGGGVYDVDNDGDFDIIAPRNYERGPVEMWINETE